MKRHGSSVSSCIGRALCAILTLVCLCLPNAALTLSTATLTGRVTDSNAAAIVGVKVDANNIDTNVTFSTVTNDEGMFVIPNLLPGRYRIFVHKDGFQSLIALTPGVVLTKSSFGEQGQFSVNGQRANANYFTVDGVSANTGVSASFSLVQSAGGALPALGASGGTNSLVSVDAMQEFKIQTSTFAPEFGRTPGGQVQIVTRSGTNDFHGTLFEYFRNDALDANDWFANSRRQPKPALRQNDFGGVLGGPLYLPRFGEGGPAFYNGKDRTFFFFSYEGLRLRQPLTQVTLVPSVASRQSAVPQMRPFLEAYPIPNGTVFANGFAEFNASYSDMVNLDATSIRVDHTFNKRLTLFGRYNYSPSESTQRGVSNSSLNNMGVTKFVTQSLTVGVTQIFSSNVNNEIRGNYTKSEGTGFFQLDDFGGAIPPSDAVLFPSFATSQDSQIFFQLIGGRNLIVGRNVENLQRQFNLVNNTSVIAGEHRLKFGVDYRQLLPVSGPRAYDQLVNFTGLTGPNGATTGNAQLVQVTARETVPLIYINFSAYGQDTWEISRRLTLTYGLRWEVNPAPKGRNGRDLFSFEITDNPATIRLAPQGTPLYETTYNNFAPRAGIVYRLSQKQGQETVLRGGIGIFYDLGSGILGNAASSFPYSRARRLTNVPFPLTTLDQAAPPPFSLDIPAAGVINASDRNLKLPRTYQWNLALEQSLGIDQTISATYVGANARRLLRLTSRLFPPGLFTNFTQNIATSDYHAMQLRFQRRISRGLQALASYTWSHSIDNISADSSAGNSPLDPNLDRGSSDFDVRHSFSAAVTYNIPTPKAGVFGNAILRNWGVDTFLTARSATPVNLVAGSSFTGGVETLIRPDLIVGIPLYIEDPNVAGGRRFNRAAFAIPPAGRQGTLGRNVLRGFSVYQVDLSVRRKFNLTERVNVLFRSDFFNLFNHPNFGDPGRDGTFLPGPLFGQSTLMLGRSLGSGGAGGGFSPLYQSGGPRSIQLAVKLNF